MKKVVYSMLVASFALFSCGGEEKKEAKEEVTKEEAASPVEYGVDLTVSTLTWNGYKGDNPDNDKHTGVVQLKEGNFTVVDDMVTAGTFVIDMTSMAETTEGADPQWSAKLIGHLGNEDFFNVASFATATFTITDADKGIVEGELSVLGKTLKIEVPYLMVEAEGNVSVTGNFSVDFKELMMPGTQMEEGGDPMEKVSDKVNFSLDILGAVKA